MKNVKAQRELERKKNEESQEDVASLYKTVFTSPHGQRLLAHLEKFCGYHEDVFQRESQSATTYMQGRQSVAIHINKIIKDTDNGSIIARSNISPNAINDRD